MPLGDEEGEEERDSEARLRTPQFDLEPFARSTIEDSEVRRLASADEIALAEKMLGAHAKGEYRAALETATLLLSLNPRQAVAAACARECREALDEELSVRLRGTPRLLHLPADARIDHRAGFVLSHIDGTTTLEELIDVCGMSRVEVLLVLDQLVTAGVVVMCEHSEK